MLRIICFHSRQADSADESKLHGRQKVQNDLAWCHRAGGNSQTQTMKKKNCIKAYFQKWRSFVNTFERTHRGRTLKRMKSRVVGDTSVIKPYDVKYARCLSEKKEKFCPLCGFHFKEITRFKCNKQVSDILQTFTLHLVWVSEALHNYHTKKTTLNVHKTCMHVLPSA